MSCGFVTSSDYDKVKAWIREIANLLDRRPEMRDHNARPQKRLASKTFDLASASQVMELAANNVDKM